MSEFDEMSLNTGYSTPVPELDDHRHQQATTQRRGTADSQYMPSPRGLNNCNISHIDRSLNTIARDFEHAVVDDDDRGVSPMPMRPRVDTTTQSRRPTVTTLDPRAVSPPNSVKAFADARRRERGLSIAESHVVSGDARRPTEELHRALSAASYRSRRPTNEKDDDARSIALSSKSKSSINSEAEEDVCFPLHDEPDKGTLHIDYEVLEEFIAEEESRDRTPPKNQPHARIFEDLRPKTSDDKNPVFSSDGDMIDVPSGTSSLFEKGKENFPALPLDENRFEFFSSRQPDTVHASEFGDLVLPGEDIRTLFSVTPGEEEESVWWLNMNNPTEEEIRAICRAFGVHPLTIEDIGTQEAREKIELFPSYYFACFRSFTANEVDDGQEFEPFNIYVIVFREGTLSFSFSPNPHATHVRKRITMLKDYVALSSDWICYALIDDIVDSFAPVIRGIETETDTIEDQVFIARTDDMQAFLRKIGMVRKNVMSLMKLLGGKADVLRGFTKRCNANYKVTPRMDIGLYLGDIQDHVVTMMTSLAHFEKMLSRAHSNYLAQLSIDSIIQGNQANKVLSKVTLLASILVPLNLVCGMFGMNVTVPFKDDPSVLPFFMILLGLILFTVFSLITARRYRYI